MGASNMIGRDKMGCDLGMALGYPGHGKRNTVSMEDTRRAHDTAIELD